MYKQNPERMYVTFWGIRGSISTPGSGTEKYGGNTPCVSVHHDSTDIVLDAGTGIRNFGLELAKQVRTSKSKMHVHVLLSHTHWDHIQGLPFFAPAYAKDVKLSIYGSPKKGNFLGAVLQGQMDVNYFPVAMDAFSADLSITEFAEPTIQIGSISVDWEEQICHPGGSVRYRLKAGGKKVVYATDVELNKIFVKNQSSSQKALARAYENFIAEADLLIADGQYTEKEYPLRVNWGHTSMQILIDAARRARVRQLAIFHHDPQHSDRILDNLATVIGPKYNKGSHPMNIFWAREGMTIAV